MDGWRKKKNDNIFKYFKDWKLKFPAFKNYYKSNHLNQSQKIIIYH